MDAGLLVDGKKKAVGSFFLFFVVVSGCAHTEEDNEEKNVGIPWWW